MLNEIRISVAETKSGSTSLVQEIRIYFFVIHKNYQMSGKIKLFNAHSFRPFFIHSGHFYSTPSNHLPLRGATDYSTDTASEFHAEAHRQLQVKDLPKGQLRDG